MKDYFYDNIQRAMNRILEEEYQSSRMLEQADLFRPLWEALDPARDLAAQVQLLSENMFLGQERFSFPSTVELSISQDALNLAQYLEDEFKDRGKLQLEVFEALHRPAIDAALASVLRHQEELINFTETIKTITQSFESIAAPAQQIQSALETLEASARLYSAPAEHWSNALSIVDSYGQFAIRQAKRLDADSAVVAERRVRVTELAGALLVPSLGANEVADSVSEADSGSDSKPLVIRPLQPRIFGPLNSHLGYVYRVAVEVDVDLAVVGALPARICQLGGAIVQAVVRINVVLRRRGDADIFRVTNRSLEAASLIPAIVTGTERDFADVVDALFFLLYEGSGACSRLSPLVSDEDLQPLWHLKNLRLYYRHDIEHGDGKDISKKHQKVGAAFVAIADKHLPARPAEWTSAQAELYQQLLDMLLKVEEAIMRQ